MGSEESGGRVGQWLQRPYVGDRFHLGGPKMTNFGVLVGVVFMQTAWAIVWLGAPISLPIATAFVPSILALILTIVMLAAE